MKNDPQLVEFFVYAKQSRWRALWVPLILVTMFAVVGPVHASGQEDLDRLPGAVQADLNAVSSTDMEVENVECELRTQGENRTFLLQRLQQARARDKRNCAPANRDQHGDFLSHPMIAPGNGEGLCGERTLEALLEEERAIISATLQDYSPEHPEIKRAERVIQELQARMNSRKKRDSMVSLEVVQLETELKDIEAQIDVLGPRHAELLNKLSQLKSRLQTDARSVPITVNPPIITSIKRSCNVVPLMVCGTPRNPGPAHWYYGYTANVPTVMRLVGRSEGGPGSFRLIQLPGGSGRDWIAQNLAGGYHQCLTRGDSVQTQPGNESGPVANGLDTRLGIYSASVNVSRAQYPPDVITTHASPLLEVDSHASRCASTPRIRDSNGGNIVTANNIDSLEIFNYKSYVAALKARRYTNAPPNGQFNRRIFPVPVGNCSASSGGSSPIPIIGFACFFLLQPPVYQGNSLWILGQYVGNCQH